jgi:hypothetical protein
VLANSLESFMECHCCFTIADVNLGPRGAPHGTKGGIRKFTRQRFFIIALEKES